MNKKDDLFFRYAENLDYISFHELNDILQSQLSVEHYLIQKKSLNATKIANIKLLIFKHHLLEQAQQEQLLTKEQCNYLVKEKIYEIRASSPPFSLLSLEVGIVSPEFFRKALFLINKSGKFSQEDVSFIHSEILNIPEEYADVFTDKEKTTIEVSQSHNDEGVMLLRYDIICKCGNEMAFEVEMNFSLRFFCTRCKSLVLDLTNKKSTTLCQAMPESIRKINRIEWSDQFAHYTLLSKLGEGGEGKVYLARDHQTQEKLALKILDTTQEEYHFDKFKKEVEILTKLQHPNIVAIREWGCHEDEPYIAMQYIPGVPLSHLIEKKGSLPPSQATKIIAYVLDALHFAQQYKVVHRDIKPENIFIATNGIVKLLDLGISKILGESFHFTKSGQMLGTPHYAAPEQILNSKNVDYRADIYSVGATLYHMLCGIPPYEEYGENCMKILWNKTQNQYMRLQQRSQYLPKRIIEIVEKSMEHDVRNRYQCAQEMKKDLAIFYRETTKFVARPIKRQNQ